MMPSERLTLPWRLGNAVVSYVAYMVQMFYPAGLAVLYPHPGASLPAWKIVGALLVLAGITVGALVWRRRRPYLLVGWLWYLVTLLPVIGLVQVGLQAMADRYTYLTQIGLYIALAFGVAHACRSWPYRRWVCGIASVLIVAVLMGCAWRQTSFWYDSETLWTHTLACTSRNIVAHNNLGAAFAGLGRVREAMAHLQDALELKPDYAEAHSNLGYALAGLGRTDEAMAHYQKALELNPNYAEAHSNLGNALVGLGRLHEAMAHLQKALELKPGLVEAQNNLGNALAGMGRIDEAMACYRKVLELKPDHAETHSNMGVVLACLGRIDEAMAHYQKALELKPNYVEAHSNLGIALARLGRIDEAMAHFRKALELNPDFVQAHNNLGVALADMGRVNEAMTHFQKALDLATRQNKQALADSLRARIASHKSGTQSPEKPLPPANTPPSP
jgi:Flp pilus assembly protein TadD